ncbi:MAG: ATP-dependent DNA ligase, partial [Myxococcota bacterium]
MRGGKREKWAPMGIVLEPPVEPMLAKRTAQLPAGDDWIFEPKWDGFRCLVFRSADAVALQSRDLKSLNRYFPEVVAALQTQLSSPCVLDGELIVARDGVLDFEALQMRIHPAASRVEKLSHSHPAAIVFWDLLAAGGVDLTKMPFSERRARLEALGANFTPPVLLTPVTAAREVAEDWFHRFEGAGFDGVMAKSKTGSYEPKKRVMLKVKHNRTMDCVVGGFRWHKNSDAGAPGGGDSVGSLLLALYADDGRLHHIGVAASFTEKKRRELVAHL